MKIRPFLKVSLAWVLALLLSVISLPRDYAQAAPIFTSEPTFTFTDPDPDQYDHFGYSVAIDGENVIIGAYNKDVDGVSDAGEAYLFNASTGEKLQTFTNPDLNMNDLLGYSVAIDGENVIIGASYKVVDGLPRAGEAYLFNAYTGKKLQTFFNPDLNDQDLFGSSVAIDGENVVIGAFGHNGFTRVGEAYLFNASTGEKLQTFENPDWNWFDYFGYSVAIDGENVIIASPNKDVHDVDDVGEVYLFNASTGEKLQTFFNPDPHSGDSFGSSVAIDGENVIIGANGKDVNRVSAGAAYLFNASTGENLQTFFNPDPHQYDSFGSSVAIDGENVIIGAYNKDVDSVSDAGAAYLFNASTGDYLQTFENPDPDSGDYFGYSVAIDGENVIIGADWKDVNDVDDAGKAYLFKKNVEEIEQKGLLSINFRNLKDESEYCLRTNIFEVNDVDICSDQQYVKVGTIPQEDEISQPLTVEMDVKYPTGGVVSAETLYAYVKFDGEKITFEPWAGQPIPPDLCLREDGVDNEYGNRFLVDYMADGEQCVDSVLNN